MHSNAFARLPMSRFVQQTFAIKSRSRQKPNKCKSFWPPLSQEGRRQLFYGRIVSANYHPLFGQVWLSSVMISVCKAGQ